jgi:hypothetical protein
VEGEKYGKEIEEAMKSGRAVNLDVPVISALPFSGRALTSLLRTKRRNHHAKGVGCKPDPLWYLSIEV